MKHLIELWESDEFTFSGETMNPKLESLVKKLRTNEAPYTGLFSIPPYCRTQQTCILPFIQRISNHIRQQDYFIEYSKQHCKHLIPKFNFPKPLYFFIISY